MAMAAVMVLMPRMVKLLMEGLMPISESARNLLQKKFGAQNIYIGLDAAVAIGHPAVISTALILMITVAIAVFLPGNTYCHSATGHHSIYRGFYRWGCAGNIVHSVLVGTVLIAYPCTWQRILQHFTRRWL